MTTTMASSTETNYLASDLSDPKFNYDLVVGTTAEAINQTLKEYLDKNPPAPVEQWYSQNDPESPLTPMDPIPGIDPFSFPKDAQPPQKLVDANFACAIKAELGLPEGLELSNIPDILILTTDSEKVNYQLFFKTLQICQINWWHGKGSLDIITQPSGKPYIFEFEVDMNLSPTDPDDEFSHLDPKTQKKLLDYGKQMFSVQQLYLDLNVLGPLQNSPTIENLPNTSPVYGILQKQFAQACCKSISNSLGQKGKLVLGYGVQGNSQPTPPTSPQTSIQPTSLNFMVVPHYNADKSEGNKKLYTLNYLMNSNNRKLELGGPFTWNWVDSSEANSYHGAMAVRRKVFLNFLSKQLDKVIKNMVFYPHISLSHSGETYHAGWSVNTIPTGKQPKEAPTFQIMTDTAPGADGFLQVLKLSPFNPTSHDDSEDSMHDSSIHGDFNYNLTADIAIKNSQIRFTATVQVMMYFHDHFLGKDSNDLPKRNYTDLEFTSLLDLAVDGDGKLKITAPQPQPKPVDSSVPFPKHVSNKLVSFDGCKIAMQEANKRAREIDTLGFEGLINEFVDLINNSSSWVFPGGQTFIFKDAAFSEYADLVAHITYADPG